MREFTKERPVNINLPPVLENAKYLMSLFDMWVLWQATGRRFLPEPGGLFEQGETLEGLIQLDGLQITWHEKHKKEKQGGF